MNLRILFILCCVTILFPVSGKAHEFVSSHELNCTEEFPCFPELKPRIEFWIEVFSRYRNDQAIFHDGDVPHRVYAVVDGLSCSGRSSRERKKIERERSKWKAVLQDLARKVEIDAPTLSPDEEHVRHLFNDPSGDDLRDAAHSVRCQQGNRDRFARGLSRYGAYREFIVDALKKSGLSTEIQYLPFVESAFNPQAFSRVGAAGLWQIMPGTAHVLGLKMGIHSDERLDPFLSTQAAVRYLKQAYEMLRKVPVPTKASSAGKALGPFVITSYNYGTVGMKKALKNFGPDFVKVLHEYEGRRFRTAVRNFYVSFLAARHVAIHASIHFPDVQLETPVQFQTVKLTRSASAKRIQELVGLSESEMKNLNPSFTRWIWEEGFLIPRGHHIQVPQKTNLSHLLASLETLPEENDPWSHSQEYRVRKGDVPCRIARTFGVNCQTLMALNGIGKRGMIRVGQRLRIPARGRATETIAAAIAPAPPPKEEVIVKPVVAIAKAAPMTTPTMAPMKPSETFGPPPPKESVVTETEIAPDEYTAQKIGERFFVQVEYEETLGHYADWLNQGFASPIRKLNRLPYGKALQPGQKIELPVTSDEQIKSFEQRRAEYHHAMHTEFFDVFEIESFEMHTIQRGDTLWSLARKFEIPEWLLKRENPKALERGLRMKDTIRIPLLKRREPETNGMIQVE